ncbi:DHH family phosphoesterase [Heyndrickxia ginsengihumi]|uniref:DHH family phosphoesterase n=1 Tax=Heyndrickxia ginsengihumi TaxID=363870 RepID=UPI001D42A89A|nr:oligoribonuclease [Heyndrickxia ginsengihumi]MBE6183186.1 oligoribonuclease [Bacillus sp. (in: firmicutes)]MCM3023858.1 oligoribonuclease [Heyndrickxia ginsengihumi]
MYRLLTHNDLDGLGCGILARLAFGEEVHVQYNSVAGLNPQVEMFLAKEDKEETLFITDLSVNEQNEKKLNDYVQHGGEVYLIDHHKSSLHLNEYSWAAVEVEQANGNLTCATSLFYKFLIEKGLLHAKKSLDQFVELVRQMDTWEWEKNGNLTAKRLNDLFFLYSIEDFEQILLHKISSHEDFTFNELEEAILDIEENKVARYIRGKKREVYQAFIDGYYAGVVHADSNHSELGNELAKEFPHLDYIAILMVGRKKISLRTIYDHVDVSEIARKYHGGGHQKASGCLLTTEAYKQFVENTFHSEPLRRDFMHNKHNLKEQKEGCLYKNHSDETFFIYYKDEGWFIETKGKEKHSSYSTFQDCEKFVKRQFKAWLVQDDEYFQYLLQTGRIAERP